MRLETCYSFTFLDSRADKLKLPIRVTLDGLTFEVSVLDPTGRQATATVSGPVAPELLTTVPGPDPIEGGPPDLYILVGEKDAHRLFMDDMTHFLSFFLDIPIRVASGDTRLIAEGELDEARFRELGTSVVNLNLTATPVGRTFSENAISDDGLRALLKKRTGLTLYARAILLGDGVAQFRELWRVLEAAFGKRNWQLCTLLAGFPPAIEMEFTETEIRELLVLRGRASHADSRIGLAELNLVRAEVSRRLPRLKCLCEQVILTKQVWGDRTRAWKRLLPLKSFVGPGGELILFVAEPGEKAAARSEDRTGPA